MAITSYGYAGDIMPNDAWARSQHGLGSEYWVLTFSNCKVSGLVGGNNEIQVSTGRMGSYGVLDEVTSAETLALPTEITGSRYYMVYARRTWGATQETSVVAEDVGASLPTSPPARNVGPGVLDDQPLALVRVTAGQSVPTVVYDLRACGGQKDFVIPSALPSTAWIDYLSAPGVRVQVGDVVYRRTLNFATGSVIWDADPTVITSGPGKGNALGMSGAAGWVTVSELDSVGRKSGPTRSLRIQARRSGDDIVFPEHGGISDEAHHFLTVSNQDFVPPDLTPVLIRYLTLGASQAASSFTCFGTYNADGRMHITDARWNSPPISHRDSSWSVIAQATWIAG